ncbi:MAG TPA: chemotaxis protein CheB [Myxococcaceae bacterium]|nr:chemotaxis protein CheB [Myxococcaceae bacterium]
MAKRTSTHRRDVIVVGASAGGVEALQQLVSRLPHELDATLLVVMHLGAESRSVLADILQRQTERLVTAPNDGEPMRRGHIYVARPDHHLLVEPGRIRVTRGPRENRTRPAVDALFRSAAYAYGSRVIGVVLSGTLDDGTAGLWSIKERGGLAVVQDPEEASHPGMPQSALEHVKIDHVSRLREMAPLLLRLSSQPAARQKIAVSRELLVETAIARESRALQLGVMELGPVTPYTCPECHGVLVQLKQGGVTRFRCHTGHAFTISNLLAQVTQGVEDMLWGSIRAIEESVLLLEQLARQARQDKDTRSARLLAKKAKEAQQRADHVRQATLEHQVISSESMRGQRRGD